MSSPGTRYGDRTERTGEEWLAALRAEDPAAVLELKALVASALRRATASFEPDDATLDDLVQVAVLRVLEKLDRYSGRSRFTTWAWSVAVHAAFSELRRERARSARAGDDNAGDAGEALEDASADPTSPVERSEIVERLHRVIERELTGKQRRAVLGELRGTPNTELAEELGTNRNALHKLLHDARAKLRRGLEAAGITDHDVRHAFDL